MKTSNLYKVIVTERERERERERSHNNFNKFGAG